MSEEEKSIISKITKKLLSFCKALLSFIVIFTIFIFLAYVLEVIVPNFSTTAYSGWVLLALLVILAKGICYLRPTSWLYLGVSIAFVLWNISTIEQYTPDRLMFHYKMNEWKKSGKKEVDIKDLTPFEWKDVSILIPYKSRPISCTEWPQLCNLSIPWLYDSDYWTMAFTQENKQIYLVRIPANGLNLGGVSGGGRCMGGGKNDVKLVLYSTHKNISPFVCYDSEQCILIITHECIKYFNILNY